MQILRSVALVIIRQHVLARDLVEEIEMADDGMPVGMPHEGGAENQPPQFRVGIVPPHGELAPDDVHLLVVFLRGNGGIENRVGKNVERRQGMIGRKIDVIDRAVERRVGVEMAAQVLDLLRQLAVAARRRALEHQVLKQVRESRAEPAALVDAAARAPELD